LRRFDFPVGKIRSRGEGQTYADVVEEEMPDLLIQDDCRSIGGEVEMTYPHMSGAGRRRVKSLVVPEFGGVDHLPDPVPNWSSG
jgi:hypothetical protein